MSPTYYYNFLINLIYFYLQLSGEQWMNKRMWRFFCCCSCNLAYYLPQRYLNLTVSKHFLILCFLLISNKRSHCIKESNHHFTLSSLNHQFPDSLNDLYENLLQREYIGPIAFPNHQVERKAQRSPSLRLRFGRRSDPGLSPLQVYYYLVYTTQTTTGWAIVSSNIWNIFFRLIPFVYRWNVLPTKLTRNRFVHHHCDCGLENAIHRSQY